MRHVPTGSAWAASITRAAKRNEQRRLKTMSETLHRESSFVWTCPTCGTDQTDIVTIHGPVMSLTCSGCLQQFDANNLPDWIVRDWRDAISRVIPEEEN